jgi:hypothetical protein
VPSTEKLPRWARRLERATTRADPNDGDNPAAGQVFNRLRSLEGLVKELSGQLERVQAGGASSVPGVSGSDVSRVPGPSRPSALSGHVSSASLVDKDASSKPAASASLSSAQKQFGRLVIGEAGQSRYVDSGFWSRINDEVCHCSMCQPVVP